MGFADPVRQVSKVTTRPAPVKGINSFDSLVAMPEGFALVLRNMYAQPYGCQMRRGYRKHAIDLGGPVESVCSHNLTVPKLYAFAEIAPTNCTLYDVTTPMVPAVTKLTGLLNARWQHINFPNAAGVSMIAVNGANNMIWVQPNSAVVSVPLGDGSGNTLGGVDPKKLIHVYAHQKRIWFVEKDSTRGWYLPPDQVVGVAKSFDFSGIWTRGGTLSQLITWTVDDGNGADDHLLAISTQGEVSVYAGLDVEGADSWSLQGVYYSGAPIGRRAAVRKGGDVLIMSEFGGVYMTDLLKSTKVNPTENNDFKYIQQLISVSISLTRNRFGWQPFVYPASNMLMVNIPATNTTDYQFAMNDITKAWSEFIGYNANCWELHNQLPFFGSFGAVYRAWEGTTDDSVVTNNFGGFDATSGDTPSVVFPTITYVNGDYYTIKFADPNTTTGSMLLYDYVTKLQTPTNIEEGDIISYVTFNSGAVGWYLGQQYLGSVIDAEVQTTFSYFDSMGTQKHYKMVRPTILSRGDFAFNFSVNTDFVFDSPLAPASFAFRNPGRWDQDVWDDAVWEGGLNTYKSWQAVTGIGTAASIRLLMRSGQETYWASTDWVYEVGGIM